MSNAECITVCVATVGAVTAAITGHLDPSLVGLLGSVIGYGGIRSVVASRSEGTKR